MKQSEINKAILLRDMIQKWEITLKQAQKQLWEIYLLTIPINNTISANRMKKTIP